MKLDGSVALLFGGARGMGRAFCQALSKHGVKIFLCDIRETEGKATCSEIASQYGADRVHFQNCDVSKPEDIKDAYKAVAARFSVPDIVINHVGILDEQQWRTSLNLNVTSVIESTKQALEYMSLSIGGKGGVIVNTASMAGVQYQRSWSPVYAASKAAIVHYTRVMSGGIQFKKHGIRMMCLCPAIVQTEMLSECILEEADDIRENHKEFTQRQLSTVGFLKPEWVSDILIDMLQKDPEMNGVAALIESRTPTYVHKD